VLQQARQLRNTVALGSQRLPSVFQHNQWAVLVGRPWSQQEAGIGQLLGQVGSLLAKNLVGKLNLVQKGSPRHLGLQHLGLADNNPQHQGLANSLQLQDNLTGLMCRKDIPNIHQVVEEDAKTHRSTTIQKHSPALQTVKI